MSLEPLDTSGRGVPNGATKKGGSSMAERRTLPVLPLRGTVIFPGITVPIGVGRPGTMRAIETALKGDHLIFTVAQRENVDEPAPEQLYTMGVIGRIGQVQRGLGGVQLLLQGEVRASALHYHSVEDSLTVDTLPIEEMKPINENDPAFAALYREPASGPGNWASGRACPRRCCTRFLIRSPTQAGSRTWSPATLTCRSARSRPCSKPWASRNGCGGS